MTTTIINVVCKVLLILSVFAAPPLTITVFASEQAKTRSETKPAIKPGGQHSKSEEQAQVSRSLEQAEAQHAARKADPKSGRIYQLLGDRETPLLGVKWGLDVFFDLPVNDEPVDSDPTIRRARVTFLKGMGTNWRAKLSVEVSDDEIEIRDNYLEYSGRNTLIAKFGIFDEPFSLESMSSTRGLTFMERSLAVTALAPGKSVGVGLLKRNETGILSGGLFFRSPEQDGLGEAGSALAVRYVRSPLFRKVNDDAHVGISLSYRTNAKTEDTRYRSRPETGVTDIRFVDTGEIAGAEKVLRLGLEHSLVKGPFSWQAELMALQVQRRNLENTLFIGGYVYASWFLTGESRRYDAGSGRFKPVTPETVFSGGGKGSVELTGRISFVDLNDKDIAGGEQSNVTLGINWRPRVNWKIMVNLIKVLDVDRPGHKFDKEDPLILSLRLQWEL